jgi:hypothetical protein
MIKIDFIGGSHGNYLEFVCNRFLAGIPTLSETPFDSTGASHSKTYLTEKKFACAHYSTEGLHLKDDQVVSIQYRDEDLLPLQLVSLLRAGNFGIDPDQLEINTYNKLQVGSYEEINNVLIANYFTNQLVDDYRAVADPTWPLVASDNDYFLLPDYIKDECEQVHGFKYYYYNSEHPDCPKHILRNFFKIGFNNTYNNGFMKNQRLMTYNESCSVFVFQFHKFYTRSGFVEELTRLADWCNMSFDPAHLNFEQLHQEFLAKQIYKTSKQDCDAVVTSVISDKDFELPRLGVMREAYIESALEQILQREINNNDDAWFTTASQLRNALA